MCKSLELLDSGFAVSSSTSRGVFQGFWRMLFYGSTLLIRLVNVHVAWLEANGVALSRCSSGSCPPMGLWSLACASSCRSSLESSAHPKLVESSLIELFEATA